MSYLYNATGTMVLKGCHKTAFAACIPFRYAVGSVVYVCQKAQKGILEAVAIKRVYLNGPRHNIPIYQSTLNSRYNERELCTHAQAVAIATNYYANRLVEIDTLLSKC